MYHQNLYYAIQRGMSRVENGAILNFLVRMCLHCEIRIGEGMCLFCRIFKKVNLQRQISSSKLCASDKIEVSLQYD